MDDEGGSIEDLPEGLQPYRYLSRLGDQPTDWITVVAYWSRPDDGNGGVRSYLVDLGAQEAAVKGYSWRGDGLGKSYAWRDEGECVFLEGLVTPEWDHDGHFFVEVQKFHDLASPQVQFTPSFLWFFDAIPRTDRSWYFLTEGGADVDLVRARIDDGGYEVEVNALPLRTYLAARRMALLLQHDVVTFSPDRVETPVQAELAGKYGRFTFSATKERIGRSGLAFSRLLGKSVVLPSEVDPCEATDWDIDRGPHPEYIYKVDPETGQELLWTCKEDELSNYFVDRGAPPYLTPVYFRREVLTRYASQPAKYQVGKHGVSCLHLWSLRMDINPAGLVEVYLGDLGKYLPAEERLYWKQFNVRPSGGMNESRIRTDFYGEFLPEGDDPIVHLQNLRTQVDRAFESRFGRRLYRQFHPDDEISWSGLHEMVTEDTSELDALVMVLAKGLVDYIDVLAVREASGVPDVDSLQALSDLVTNLTGEPDVVVQPLRDIQSWRSSGSAHSKGKKFDQLVRRLDLEDARPSKQFNVLLQRGIHGLEGLKLLLEASPEDQ